MWLVRLRAAVKNEVTPALALAFIILNTWAVVHPPQTAAAFTDAMNSSAIAALLIVGTVLLVRARSRR